MELVRCRMCGREVQWHLYNIGKYFVRCDCGIETGCRETLQEAVNDWNKLMGVTLDELREIHENSYKCGSCILKEKSKHCVVADLFPNQEHIEKIVHEWRAKKNESGKANKSGR